MLGLKTTFCFRRETLTSQWRKLEKDFEVRSNGNVSRHPFLSVSLVWKRWVWKHSLTLRRTSTAGIFMFQLVINLDHLCSNLYLLYLRSHNHNIAHKPLDRLIDSLRSSRCIFAKFILLIFRRARLNPPSQKIKWLLRRLFDWWYLCRFCLLLIVAYKLSTSACNKQAN